jgi:hypothetical protein
MDKSDQPWCQDREISAGKKNSVRLGAWHKTELKLGSPGTARLQQLTQAIDRRACSPDHEDGLG